MWLADENFGNDILRGLRRRDPRFDVVRVQDILELGGSDDPAVLEWAGINERILPTHDVSTMVPAILANLRTSAHNSPVVFVPKSTPIGCAIHDIGLLDRASVEADWIAGVIYLPLG